MAIRPTASMMPGINPAMNAPQLLNITLINTRAITNSPLLWQAKNISGVQRSRFRGSGILNFEFLMMDLVFENNKNTKLLSTAAGHRNMLHKFTLFDSDNFIRIPLSFQ